MPDTERTDAGGGPPPRSPSRVLTAAAADLGALANAANGPVVAHFEPRRRHPRRFRRTGPRRAGRRRGLGDARRAARCGSSMRYDGRVRRAGRRAGGHRPAQRGQRPVRAAHPGLLRRRRPWPTAPSCRSTGPRRRWSSTTSTRRSTSSTGRWARTAPTRDGALSDLVATGRANLEGNGANLHDTLDGLSQALSTLADGRQDLFGIVANLQTVHHRAGPQRPAGPRVQPAAGRRRRAAGRRARRAGRRAAQPGHRAGRRHRRSSSTTGRR